MGLLRLFLALSVVIHHLPQRSFAWLNAGVPGVITADTQHEIITILSK